MSDIVAGDVVRLRTGGPAMTVEVIKGDYASCVWFDDTGGYGGQATAMLGGGPRWTGPLRHTFSPSALVKAEPAT